MKIKFNVKAERKVINPDQGAEPQSSEQKKCVHTVEDFVWMMKVFGLMLLILLVGFIPSIHDRVMGPKIVLMLVMLVPAVLVFLRIAKSKRESAELVGMSKDEQQGWNLKTGFWFLFFISLQASLSSVGDDTPGIWTPWVWLGSWPSLAVGTALTYIWRDRLPMKWKKRTMLAGLTGTILLGGVATTWLNVSGSSEIGREEVFSILEINTHYRRRGSDWYSAKLSVPELSSHRISIQISADEYNQVKKLWAQKQKAFYALKLHEGNLGHEWASNGHLVAFNASG